MTRQLYVHSNYTERSTLSCGENLTPHAQRLPSTTELLNHEDLPTLQLG